MTVKRDEPEYPNVATVGTAQDKSQKPAPADKNKKPGTTPPAGQPTAVVPPKTPATAPVVQTKPTVAPVVPPPATQTATSPTAAPGTVPPNTEQKTASNTQSGITEQQTPGNIPLSTNASPKEAGITPGNSIIEGGENLGRETQRELARLGCFSGNISERWGKEGRAAIKRFNVASRYSWDDWPNPDLLASLKRYPEGYCKKCRGGGGDCELAGTEPNKAVTPPAVSTTAPETKPAEKNPVTAAAPPPVSEKPAPPVATPPAAAKEPAEKPEGGKVATKTEEGAEGGGSVYLPPSLQKKPEGADDEGDEKPKKKKSIVSREPDDEPDTNIAPRSKPRRETSQPRSTPKPRTTWSRPVEREYSRPQRSYSQPYYGGGGGSRSSWDSRPQGVGR